MPLIYQSRHTKSAESGSTTLYTTVLISLLTCPDNRPGQFSGPLALIA